MPSRAAGSSISSAPSSLVSFGESAEALFDASMVEDWPKVDRALVTLETARRDLEGAHPLQQTERSQIDEQLRAAKSSRATTDASTLLRAANELTRIAIDLGAAYATRIPIQVARLDYLGRKLQLGAKERDPRACPETVATIRSTWDAVRPAVAGRDEPRARAFDALVVRMERATSLPDYAALAKMELDQVDEIERVFER